RSGPRALAGEPNDFADMRDAQARVQAILASQTQPHHTYLEIVEYTGEKLAFLGREGILF
ncbi:MAG: hypothetical protein AAFN17_12230, partial [Pseudomonadota bacterium]